MDKKNRLFGLVGICMAAALILASCSTAQTLTATAGPAASPTISGQVGSSPEVPTNTPAAVTPGETETPVPAVTAPSTPAATATPAPTLTAAAPATAAAQGQAQVVPTLNAYCRKGPGTGYDAITFLLKDSAYTVTGRDSLDNWWLVQAPGNVNCWVGDANVVRQGAVEQAPIVQGQPLPGTSALFVNTYKCDVAQKTLGVSFNWAAVSNASGYLIFRNGSQVAEVGSTATSYFDNAPPGVDLVYELEAFNAFGVTLRLSTYVPACK